MISFAFKTAVANYNPVKSNRDDSKKPNRVIKIKIIWIEQKVLTWKFAVYKQNRIDDNKNRWIHGKLNVAKRFPRYQQIGCFYTSDINVVSDVKAVSRRL